MSTLEERATFGAKKAARNLAIIRQQAEMMDPVKLDRSIKHLETMIWLHSRDLEVLKELKGWQNKNAQRTGWTRLSGSLKQLVTSIIPLIVRVDKR